MTNVMQIGVNILKRTVSRSFRSITILQREYVRIIEPVLFGDRIRALLGHALVRRYIPGCRTPLKLGTFPWSYLLKPF